MAQPAIPPARPPPSYRLGIIGPADPPGAQATEALATLIRHAATALVAAQGNGRPRLRLVATLTPGLLEALLATARAVAAEAALAGRFDLALDLILPDAGSPGRPENAGAWQAAQAWQETAALAVMVLDGPGDLDARVHRIVGRMVMRNCDLLTVLTPAAQAEALDPQAELLRHAARQGPSVLWLCPDAAAAPPRLVRHIADLLRADPPPDDPPGPGQATPAGELAWTRLREELATALTPPEAHGDHPHSILERLVFRLRPGRAHPRRYEEFLAERAVAGGGLWAAYGLARSQAGGGAGDRAGWIRTMAVLLLLIAWPGLTLLPAPARGTGLAVTIVVTLVAGFLLWRSGARPRWRLPRLQWRRGGRRRADRREPPARLYWRRAYHAPDRLSVAYANRYRSSYVIVILLIALALILAVLGLAFADDPHTKALLVALEAVALLGIAGFVAATMAGRWQEKWVGYRLLAELCRKQDALARLGWSLPVFDVRSAAEAGLADGRWISWHFNALLRAAPLPQPDMSTAGKRAIRQVVIGILDPADEAKARYQGGLIPGQIRYHGRRATVSAAAADTWAFWGEVAFLGTVVCVVFKLFIKLAGIGKGAEIWLSTLAAALPAVSAAFFALRAYSEEKLMAEQSRLMQADLEQALDTIAAIPLSLPLSGQELALQTFEVAERMLADVAGWAQLVRVKVVEAG